jgi:uncharacterized protein involved in exopolysaccharide biosynthesis
MLNLAVRLGVSVGGAEASTSPQFFSDMAVSRGILGSVALDTFEIGVGADHRRGTLASLYRIMGPSPAVQREYVLRRLEKDVASRVDLRTGVIAITVRAPDPNLAVTIASKITSALDRFNQDSRRLQSGAERRFAESRRLEITSELHAAEDTVRNFVLQNRLFQGSPALQLEYARKMRAVDGLQSVYNSITQEYEQARIDEVRDTPVLTVIQTPEVPALPLPRGLIRKAVLLVFLAIPFGMLIAVLTRRSEVVPVGLSDADTWSEVRRCLKTLRRFGKAAG